MTAYEAFRCSSLDTTGIGLATEPETSNNLFTPLGAALIGWAEHNNAHFCFLEGFGNTVFLVDPGIGFGEFVYPVARSFPDFLGLILACRGTEAITRAWCWSRLRFEQFLEKLRLSYKQRSILRAIQNTYQPPEISDPFSYLMEVRRGFDGRNLQFSPDLSEYGGDYHRSGEINVTFSSNFWAGKSKGKPGRKQVLNQTFSWGGKQWHIPAIYTCQEGLVLDFCVEASPDQILAFQEKYRVPPKAQEDLQSFNRENPLNVNAAMCLTLNGKRLPEKRGCSTAWNPWLDNSWEDLSLLEYYGCDREKGWVFLRKSFPWYHNRRRPAIQSLKLTLEAKPVPIPGPQFQAPPVGESIVLAHPVTGDAYTLTVQEYAHEELDRNFLFDFPRNYVRMAYTLSPELPDTAFAVRDCAANDPSEPPVILENPEISGGIIGGEDGPTAIYLSHPGQANCHTACSSFHFARQDSITWRMDFREKPREDLTIDLFR